MKRVLFGGLYHESHSFVAGLTQLEQCEVRVGKEMLSCDTSSPLGAALQEARELGWQIVPSLDVRAMPGAIVAQNVFDFWIAAFEAALCPDLDGVFLVLHGAMVCEEILDVEGEVLARLRQKIGSEIPIGGVTDLHANFSPKMAQNSDALLTYRENPHTDAAQTARLSVGLFDRILRGERTKTLFQATQTIWPPTWTATAQNPMRELETRAREIEKMPNVRAVNIHAGYAYADTPSTGASFSAIVDEASDTAPVENALRQLAARVQVLDVEMRAAKSPELSIEEAMRETQGALRLNDFPVLLVEPSDNIGGGAPGDATHLLRAFWQHEIENAGVILCDARAVLICENWEIGQRGELSVGAWSGALAGEPFEGEFQLLAHSDGRFALEDAHSHLASIFGSEIEMGRSVLLQTVASPKIVVLLSSKPIPPFDLGQWRALGIAPETLSAIGIKAAVGHRQAYLPIARREIFVRTPGVCSSDLSQLPYRFAGNYYD